MSRFVNSETGIVVSVADEKDERFGSPLWKQEDAPAPKKAAAKSSSDK